MFTADDSALRVAMVSLGKVGAFLNLPDVNLRVSTPKRGSFEIAVLAAMVAHHEAQFHTMEQARDWGKRIFDIIKEVMNLKKETKRQPYDSALRVAMVSLGKVGAFLNLPDVNLRVSTPKRGSFEIAVLAAMVAHHEAQFHTMEQAWDWAKRIFDIIKEVMNLKKETKGQPYKIEVSKGHGGVTHV